MAGMNIIILIVVSLLSPSVAAGQNTGLHLLGRVYDTDKVNDPINDADLLIYISERPPDQFIYPKDGGEYVAVSFNLDHQKSVKILATHPKYAQMERIDYITTGFQETQNVRMKYKPAKAEANYLEARALAFNSSSSSDQLLKAFDLMQEAITLSPKSRYLLFQADNVGRYVQIQTPESTGVLPLRITDFARPFSQGSFFSDLSEKERYEFYIKLGHGFARTNMLDALADGHRSYLAFAVEAYDAAIKIDSRIAVGYQGKYLIQRDVGNYFDAIDTIRGFFYENDPVKSELTIKGFLVDWVDYLKESTDYEKDDPEIQRIRNTSEYLEAWKELRKRLDQYRGYFRSKTIKGNKNLQDAREIAHVIVEGIEH